MASQGGAAQFIAGHVISFLGSDTACPDSSDGKHHSDSYVYDNENGYYRCVCSFCGQSFTGSPSSAYNDYVDTLPATGIDSDGALYWYPTFYDAYGYDSNPSKVDRLLGFTFISQVMFYADTLTFSNLPSYATYSISSDFRTLHYRTYYNSKPSSSVNLGLSRNVAGYMGFYAPITGMYFVVPNRVITGTVTGASGSSYNVNFVNDEYTIGNKNEGVLFYVPDSLTYTNLDLSPFNLNVEYANGKREGH